LLDEVVSEEAVMQRLSAEQVRALDPYRLLTKPRVAADAPVAG
jgi:hypothetical protein